MQLMTPLRSKPEARTTALQKGVDQALSQMGHFRWFMSNLDQVLGDAGFGDIEHAVSSTDCRVEERGNMGRCCVGAVYSILRRQAHSKAERMRRKRRLRR